MNPDRCALLCREALDLGMDEQETHLFIQMNDEADRLEDAADTWPSAWDNWRVKVAEIDAFTQQIDARQRRAAHQLHIELARLGIRNHAAFAGMVLKRHWKRPVSHLRQLCFPEMEAVRAAAKQHAQAREVTI